jgi:hypothetical protein
LSRQMKERAGQQDGESAGYANRQAHVRRAVMPCYSWKSVDHPPSRAAARESRPPRASKTT